MSSFMFAILQVPREQCSPITKQVPREECRVNIILALNKSLVARIQVVLIISCVQQVAREECQEVPRQVPKQVEKEVCNDIPRQVIN